MIISASRRTDIPCYYGDWLLARLRANFVYVVNPYNPKSITEVILRPELIDAIVFWTKNPEPLLARLPEIDRLGYKYYFQCTLTSYDATMERGLPPKSTIVKSMQKLADMIGGERIIWRYDPVLLTNDYDISYHLKWFEYLAGQLATHVCKCVFSFVQLYRKCQSNLRDVRLEPLTPTGKNILVRGFSEIAKAYSLPLESCASGENFAELGIHPAQCIDARLITAITGRPVTYQKDRNQRALCGCTSSVDIGSYNSCHNFCRYCYANVSEQAVHAHAAAHDPASPMLLGWPMPGAKILKRPSSLSDNRQLSLFATTSQDK